MSLKSYIRNNIPQQYIYRLTHLKKSIPLFGGAAFPSYSGNGEDILLTQYLFKNKRNGTYVDVGAFHPKIISNTYLLNKKFGWSGINIDPNPEAIYLFKRYRRKDINLEMGIAEHSTEQTYYNFSYSGGNTFDKEMAEKKIDKPWNTLVSKSKISCSPLSDIFDEHIKEGQQIDLLDIDVEGADLSALKSNDWSKYRPSVILVEDRLFQTELEKSEVYTYLKSKNYNFFSYLEMTLVMTAEEFKK